MNDFYEGESWAKEALQITVIDYVKSPETKKTSYYMRGFHEM